MIRVCFCLGLTGKDVVVSVLAAVLRQQSRVLALRPADIFKVLTLTKVLLATETREPRCW